MGIVSSSSFKNIFFANKTVRQTIFKNTFWLSAANGIAKLLKLVLFIYVARILGATEYGKFTFAMAFIGLFTIFFDLGLSQIITRELSKGQEYEKEFPAMLSLKIILPAITLVLILFFSFFITKDDGIRKVIWILTLCVMFEHFYALFVAFFQARQKMEYQAFAIILSASLLTIAGFFSLFYFPSVQNLSYSYLFAATITLIFVLFLFHFKIQKLSISWDRSIWRKFLLLSWPVALAGVFGGIYTQIDSVMMGYLGQMTQTGWYNAASRIVMGTLIPMGLIATSFFPVLSKTLHESKERLQKIWNYQMEIMIFLAIPLVIGGLLFAAKIIDFIYSPSYFPSILVFQILIVMAGSIFINNPFYQILIVFNQQQKIFWTVLLGAVTDVVLNLILIPRLSLYGAAITTLVTYFLILFLLLKFTLGFTSIRPFNMQLLLSFIGASLSGLIMYFAISQPRIYNLNILFAVSAGVVVYLISFLVYRKLVNKFMLAKI